MYLVIGITTSNANALDEPLHSRHHLCGISLYFLDILVKVHGIQQRRLQDFVEHHFGEGTFLEQIKAVGEAQEAWKRKFNGAFAPRLRMYTCVSGMLYLSLDRITSSHWDHNDLGFSFQFYSGTTKPQVGFCLTHLAVGVIHGPGSANVFRGNLMLHGSVKPEGGGLRGLAALFCPKYLPGCFAPEYRMAKKVTMKKQ